MKYLVTNFAYGYGPFLRTTELARAVNTERVTRGLEPLGIIVPWVYGDDQKRIMREEFGDASDIFLNEPLGAILKSVFYANSSYKEALEAWVETYPKASANARAYLSGNLEVTSLSGKDHTIKGKDILFSLARAPRVSFTPLPSYSATFGHISEILEHTENISLEEIEIDRALVQRAIPIARSLEEEQTLIGLGTPGTFSYVEYRKPLGNEMLIPPTIRAPYVDTSEMSEGIYVTITGISGLERLYAQAQSLGLTVYTNDPERLLGSIKASPNVLGNSAIKLCFARAGWGSIWGAQLLGKAVIVPPFDPTDDPEIYFNNKCIVALGLGIEYTGQDLAELISEAVALEPGIRARNEALLTEFGTLDGNEYVAKKIVDVQLS